MHQKRIAFIENDRYIERTALEPIVHKEIKDLQAWCLQKGIGFDVSLTAKEVLTDGKWLGFILRQLLSNAVKYSQASDIIVESGALEGRTWLRIRDFGRGSIRRMCRASSKRALHQRRRIWTMRLREWDYIWRKRSRIRCPYALKSNRGRAKGAFLRCIFRKATIL